MKYNFIIMIWWVVWLWENKVYLKENNNFLHFNWNKYSAILPQSCLTFSYFSISMEPERCLALLSSFLYFPFFSLNNCTVSFFCHSYPNSRILFCIFDNCSIIIFIIKFWIDLLLYLGFHSICFHSVCPYNVPVLKFGLPQVKTDVKLKIFDKL